MIDECFLTKEINEEGKYLVRLFDLPSQEWITYEIDDRLFTKGSQPRFGKGSVDSEVPV